MTQWCEGGGSRTVTRDVSSRTISTPDPKTQAFPSPGERSFTGRRFKPVLNSWVFETPINAPVCPAPILVFRETIATSLGTSAEDPPRWGGSGVMWCSTRLAESPSPPSPGAWAPASSNRPVSLGTSLARGPGPPGGAGRRAGRPAGPPARAGGRARRRRRRTSLSGRASAPRSRTPRRRSRRRGAARASGRRRPNRGRVCSSGRGAAFWRDGRRLPLTSLAQSRSSVGRDGTPGLRWTEAGPCRGGAEGGSGLPSGKVRQTKPGLGRGPGLRGARGVDWQRGQSARGVPRPGRCQSARAARGFGARAETLGAVGRGPGPHRSPGRGSVGGWEVARRKGTGLRTLGHWECPKPNVGLRALWG